jgi:hypothetical protein
MRPILIIIPFLLSAINIPFIIQNPKVNWWNWAAAIFCLGIGITNAIILSI